MKQVSSAGKHVASDNYTKACSRKNVGNMLNVASSVPNNNQGWWTRENMQWALTAGKDIASWRRSEHEMEKCLRLLAGGQCKKTCHRWQARESVQLNVNTGKHATVFL